MKEIPITKGKIVIVDDEDYEWLNQWKWHCTGSGYAAHRYGYKGKIVRMHRLIMNTPIGLETDHINMNRLDNRRENLRICTRSENQANRKKPKNNKSGYKGVSWSTDRKKWLASININHIPIHLGYFKNAEDAAHVYDEAAIKYFGEFAKLNELEML